MWRPQKYGETTRARLMLTAPLGATWLLDTLGQPAAPAYYVMWYGAAASGVFGKVDVGLLQSGRTAMARQRRSSTGRFKPFAANCRKRRPLPIPK